MIRQADDNPFTNDVGHRVFDGTTCFFINDMKDRFYIFSYRLFLRPTRQPLGDRIQKRHRAAFIRGDHGIADTGQGDLQGFRLFLQRGLGRSAAGISLVSSVTR